MNTREELLDILKDYIDTPIEEVDTAAGLKLAVGLDSFILFSFIRAIEEHFSISIPNENLLMMTNLDDIIAYVDEHRK